MLVYIPTHDSSLMPFFVDLSGQSKHSKIFDLALSKALYSNEFLLNLHLKTIVLAPIGISSSRFSIQVFVNLANRRVEVEQLNNKG